MNKIDVMKKEFLFIISLVLMLITGCNHTENNGFCGYYLGDSYSEIRRQLNDSGVSYKEDYMDDYENIIYMEFNSKFNDKTNKVKLWRLSGEDAISMISTNLYMSDLPGGIYSLRNREQLKKVRKSNQEALKNIFNGCSKWELDVTNSHYSSPENYLTYINEAEYPVIFTYNRNSSGTIKLLITIDEQLLWAKDLLSVEATLVDWKLMKPYINIFPETKK